jgi:hypothetical protein
MISYIFYIIIRYHDLVTLFSAMFVVGGYITMNVIMEPTINWRVRVKMAVFAPTMYIFFFLLSFVEYFALIKGLLNMHTVKESIKPDNCGWQHVERPELT